MAHHPGSAAPPSPATAAPARRPALGVDSFAYHRWLGERNRFEDPAPASWTLHEVIAEARRVRAEVVSIQTIHLPGHDADTLAALRAELADAGLGAILAWGHRSGLEDGRNPAKLADALAALHEAVQLGCGLVRVVGGDHHSYRPDAALRAERLERLRRPLQTIAAEAERLGLLVAVENHADGPVGELAGLVDSIGSPSLGLCLDVGNAARVGEDPAVAARAAAPRCFMAHLRDLRVQEASRGDPTAWWPCVALGDGDLAIPDVLAELVRAPGCRAWLMETSNVLPGCFEPDIVEAGLAYLRAVLGTAG